MAFTGERKPTDLAAHFALFSLVAIILGTARHKFHNVTAITQFIFELSQKLPEWWIRLPWLARNHHRIGVQIQTKFLEQF